MSRLFGDLRQVGIVVRDIEAAMRHWVEVCGVGPWFYTDRLAVTAFTYAGRRYDDIHVSIALANSGDVQLELIQQRSDHPSMYRDFLAAGHEGMQHWSSWPTDYEARYRRALASGYTVGQEGDSPRGRVAHFLADLSHRLARRGLSPTEFRLMVKDDEQVKAGQKLAEWDPYTMPLIAELDGLIRYVDLEDGSTMREETDDVTGLSNRVVIQQSDTRRATLRPQIQLVDPTNPQGDPITLPRTQAPARYFLSPGAILNIDNGDTVKAGDVLARIPREAGKTKDITGGLPRVVELFEARKPKNLAFISPKEGAISFGKDIRGKRRVLVEPDDGSDAVEFQIPKGSHITVQEGDRVRKGDRLMEGSPAPHDILSVLGVEALAKYLTDEVQEVYRLQGVKINDKHIEVIVRQMMRRVQITDPGSSMYVAGEQVERRQALAVNRGLEADGKVPASFEPVLLGITKSSLNTESFISAASFQETTRVITEAALAGKVDWLNGLKENVILGRLLPAGTGLAARLAPQPEAEHAEEVEIEEASMRSLELEAELGHYVDDGSHESEDPTTGEDHGEEGGEEAA